MQTPLILFALGLAFLWAFFGWQKGSVFEVRGLLVTFFSTVLALLFWHKLATLLGDTLGLGAGASAALVFVILIIVSRLFVSYVLNRKAKPYKPAADNKPDKGLGAAAGFVSGLLLGSTIALLVNVGTSGEPVADPTKPVSSVIVQLPIKMFHAVERSVANVPESSYTLLPSVQIDPDKPDRTKLVWE